MLSACGGHRLLAQTGISTLCQSSRAATLWAALQNQPDKTWFHSDSKQQQQRQQQWQQQQQHTSGQQREQPASWRQRWHWQQQLVLLPAAARSISSTASPSAGHDDQQQQLQRQQQQQQLAQQLQWQPVTDMTEKQLGASSDELNSLLQVLLQPMPKVATWNSQLSPYMLQVNGQLLMEPSAVLLSMLRALHVIRGVLQADGQVYVVENNRLLRPLIMAAARSCLNPNMWFHYSTWSPGTLTNYASHNRLFKEAHQPNRRLFAAKGLAMVNPLCPEPPMTKGSLPRLTWQDKWLLYRRSRSPGFRQLLEDLMDAEDGLYRFKPAGSLHGVPRDLSLMVFLDSTKNAVAIKEAFHRNIPTIALVNTVNDMSQVTYPVLARDFSPDFVHFFLDWIVKVANVAPGRAPQLRQELLTSEAQPSAAASSRRRGSSRRRRSDDMT